MKLTNNNSIIEDKIKIIRKNIRFITKKDLEELNIGYDTKLADYAYDAAYEGEEEHLISSLIAIPYSILSEIAPIKTIVEDGKAYAAFGTFPNSTKRLDSALKKEDLSVEQYHIHGIPHKINDVGGMATVFSSSVRHCYITPILWDYYPKHDLLVTSKILFNRSFNDFNYSLSKTFVNEMLDKRTLSEMTEMPKIQRDILSAKFEIAYHCTRHRSLKAINDVADKMIMEFNQKICELDSNFSLSYVDPVALQNELLTNLNRLSSNLNLYIEYAKEYEDIYGILTKDIDYQEDDLVKDMAYLEEVIFPKVRDEKIKDDWFDIVNSEKKIYESILNKGIQAMPNPTLEPTILGDFKTEFRSKLQDYLIRLIKYMNSIDYIKLEIGDPNSFIGREFKLAQTKIANSYRETVLKTIEDEIKNNSGNTTNLIGYIKEIDEYSQDEVGEAYDFYNNALRKTYKDIALSKHNKDKRKSLRNMIIN